jgi:hypothetical protein
MFLQGTDLVDAYMDAGLLEQSQPPVNATQPTAGPNMNERMSTPISKLPNSRGDQAPRVQQQMEPTHPPQHDHVYNPQMDMGILAAPRRATSEMMRTSHQTPSAARTPAAPRKSDNQDDESYMDRLWNKKRDVTKFIMFAFVILLAVSAHALIEFYIKYTFSVNVLTFKQQLMIRAAYPFLVVLLLWNIKTFML